VLSFRVRGETIDDFADGVPIYDRLFLGGPRSIRGVEYRDIVAMGLPRLRRYRWAQIDRIVLDLPDCIAVDVWDGTRAFLPQVADRQGLAAALEKTAAARAIPVRGGVGLDEIPDAPDFAEESEA
jgi:hypothetical protein